MTSYAPPPGHPLRPEDPIALGHYTLQRRLGEGGMGTVFYGRAADGRPVAVKVIRREFAQDAEFRRRFEREADSARRVMRFCTAELLDFDSTGDMPYLVTEFVDGPTLAQVMTDRGPLTAANLELLAVNVATALTAIHGAGIVHRDLKPGNVMLSPFGPRVIDFGVARATDAVGVTQYRVGTPAFMAPEQVLGAALTPAVDIFAWGAVVAYAGTGRLPFGSDSNGLFGRILNEPPDLDGLRSHEFLLPIVRRAMSKDPAERPAANELLLSLVGGTTSSALAEAAVTQVLAEWPPEAPAETTPLGALPSDPQRTPYEPPTAATVLPPSGPPAAGPPTAGIPTSGPRVPPPPGPRTVGPRTVASPPARADERVPAAGPPAAPPPAAPPEQFGAGPDDRVPAAPPARPADAPPSSPPPRGGRRRGRLVVALVAVLVVAAAVVVGVLVLGGDKGNTPTGSGSGSASPVSVAIPTSTALSATTIVAARPGGGLVTLGSAGSAEQELGDDVTRQLPALAPDRTTIAYATTDGTLWLAAADGSGARKLLVGAAADLKPCSGARVTWSPDSAKVAVCASGTAGAGLYVVDPTTGTARKLPTPAKVGDPAWSPKGDVILYWSGGSADGGPLYTVAADGSGQPTKLTDAVDAQPVWAPNAQHITFRRQTPEGGFDVVGTRADGDQAHFFNFTDGSTAADTSPSYAPSVAGGGEEIVFVSDRSGTPQLYTFNPSDRPPVATLVPDQSGGATAPSWSSGPTPS